MSLDDLYEDGGRLDVDLLRSALLPYMRLVRNARTEDEAIRPTAAFEDLSARGKTLVVLLAQRARAALDDIAPDDVPVGPAAIAGWTGMAGGTLRPLLRRLVGERLVAQPARGLYSLPLHAVEKAARELAEGHQND